MFSMSLLYENMFLSDDGGVIICKVHSIVIAMSGSEIMGVQNKQDRDLCVRTGCD